MNDLVLNTEALLLFQLLFSTFAAAWLAAYAWRHQAVPGARPSALAFAAIAAWLSSIVVMIAFPNWPAEPIRLAGQSSLILSPLGWLALTLALSGRERWLAPRRFILFAIVPLASVILLLTNQWHGLMYASPPQVVDGALRLIKFSYRPAFALAATYSFFLVFLGVPLLLRAASRGHSALRGQVYTILAGGLLPSIAGLADTFGLRPIPTVDSAPLTVGLGGLIIAWGLFRYRLFDVIPIARYKIFEAMPDGVIVMDDKGRIVDLNLAAEAIIGRLLHTVLGQKAVDALKPYPALVNLCSTASEGRAEFGAARDGDQRFFEATLSALADAAGRAIGSIVTMHDITDRLVIERALRQSEQRFHDLADSLPETVFETDLTGRLTFGNQSGLQKFGFTEADLRAGINVMQCIVPEDRERATGNFARTLQDLSRESNVYTAVRRDGTRFPISIYATRILREGTPVGLRGFLVDNTDRAKAEAQALEQERALAILGERERLARDLHDNLAQVLGFVNTQAQAIRGFLSAGQTTSLDGQLARLISVVQEAHGEVREYILSVKNLSSPGWALFPALEQTLSRYQKNYGLQTELVIPPDLASLRLPPAAEVQVERIVQEALTNTRKHARARVARVAFARLPLHVRVTVEDDGDGFDADRASSYDAQTFGLCIMRERAQEIGASLDLQSVAGEGTRITILVPLAQEVV